MTADTATFIPATDIALVSSCGPAFRIAVGAMIDESRRYVPVGRGVLTDPERHAVAAHLILTGLLTPLDTNRAELDWALKFVNQRSANRFATQVTAIAEALKLDTSCAHILETGHRKGDQPDGLEALRGRIENMTISPFANVMGL